MQAAALERRLHKRHQMIGIVKTWPEHGAIQEAGQVNLILGDGRLGFRV